MFCAVSPLPDTVHYFFQCFFSKPNELKKKNTTLLILFLLLFNSPHSAFTTSITHTSKIYSFTTSALAIARVSSSHNERHSKQMSGVSNKIFLYADKHFSFNKGVLFVLYYYYFPSTSTIWWYNSLIFSYHRYFGYNRLTDYFRETCTDTELYNVSRNL